MDDFPLNLIGKKLPEVHLACMKRGFMCCVRFLDEPVDKSTLAPGCWWMIIRVSYYDIVMSLEEISDRVAFEERWAEELKNHE